MECFAFFFFFYLFTFLYKKTNIKKVVEKKIQMCVHIHCRSFPASHTGLPLDPLVKNQSIVIKLLYYCNDYYLECIALERRFFCIQLHIHVFSTCFGSTNSITDTAKKAQLEDLLCNVSFTLWDFL